MTGIVPLERAYDDGESVLYAKRDRQAARAARGSHRHGARRRATSPGGSRTAAVHRARRDGHERRPRGDDRARALGGEAELAYDLALLFFPREELGPARQPAAGRLRATAPLVDEARARDLPRADRQHAAARLPRQPQRAGRLRGPLRALRAAVARRERDQARDRRAARDARAGAPRRRGRRSRSSARCCA